jgi:hypothetical protein
MTSGGGIFLSNKNNKTNILNFINNSAITSIARGSYGYTSLLILKDPSISTYKHLSYNEFGNPIVSIIIKICYIEIKGKKKLGLNKLSQSSFTDEVNIQSDVYMKTMSYLQPLCPGIIYADVLENKDENTIILQNLALKLYKKDIPYVTKFGIIAMEFAKGYRPLYYELITATDEVRRKYYSMVYYILIELAIKTGYTHGDFHTSNIMINVNDESYFKNTKGSILLIDFGMAKKIPSEHLNTMKDAFKQHRMFNKMLDLICQLGRSDENVPMNIVSRDVYGYVCDPFNKQFYFPNGKMGYVPANIFQNVDHLNFCILNYFVEKNMATQDIIDHNAKQKDRNKYPLLPLSDSIKKNMYKGMIEDATKNINVSIQINKKPIKNKSKSKSYEFPFREENDKYGGKQFTRKIRKY